MNIDWTKAPHQAEWYQPATGLVNAAWFCKDGEDNLYYACLENTHEWFLEADQQSCKEWQWIARGGK